MANNKFNINWQSTTGVIALLSLVLALYVEANNQNQPSPEYSNRLMWIFFGIVLVYGIITIFQARLFRAYYTFSLWVRKQKQSTLIIDKRLFRINILNSIGDDVDLYEETFFTRIKKSKSYSAEMQVQGHIDVKSIRSCNCSYKKRDNGNMQVFFLSDALVNQGLSNKRASFFSYSVNIRDSFTEKKEYWDFPVVNFTKSLEVQIVFPNDRRPKSANILVSKESYLVREMSFKKKVKYQHYTQVPVINSLYSSKAKINLFNLQIGKFYRLEWVW